VVLRSFVVAEVIEEGDRDLAVAFADRHLELKALPVRLLLLPFGGDVVFALRLAVNLHGHTGLIWTGLRRRHMQHHTIRAIRWHLEGSAVFGVAEEPKHPVVLKGGALNVLVGLCRPTSMLAFSGAETFSAASATLRAAADLSISSGDRPSAAPMLS